MSPTKMWVLVSFGRIVGEPAKSEAEIAKRLGISRQYLNRQFKKGKNHFKFQGLPVLVMRRMEYEAEGKEFETANQMADALGVSRAVVARVLKNDIMGVVRTKSGKEVRIFKMPGSNITASPRPIPAIRVKSEIGGVHEFSCIAAASRELEIDPKTIPSALRSGRDSFTRKSDGMKFTVEIPGEKLSPQKQFEQELSRLDQASLKAVGENNWDKVEEIGEQIEELKILPRDQPRKFGKPKDTMENYLKETRVIDRELHAAEDEEKLAAWVDANAEELPPLEEEDERERERMKLITGERNPFHPDIWRKIQNAPMDPEFDYLKNMHHLLPRGFRVKGCHEKDNETRILVVGERFDHLVADGVDYAELEFLFPFPAPLREILESYPYMPILPLDVEDLADGEKWHWRVKIIKK